MAKRAYGQFCGLVRALELVGERWTLIIVRDLLVGPQRFSDLRRGLPRIPTNILSARLKELEQAAIVHRRILPRPSGSVVYELTEYGNELEEIVLRLGRWGARLLTKPGPEEIVTANSMIMAMRSTFRPKEARGLDVSYELRLGEVVIHMSIKNGRLTAAEGALPDADLVIKTGPGVKVLMTGEVSPAEAIANRSVRLSGDSRLLSRFVDTFHI